MSPLSISKRKFGTENLLQSHNISGATENESGVTVERDESLPRVVVRAKLAKAIAAAGKDFMRE